MSNSKKEKAAVEQRPQKSQMVILQHTEEAALTQLERNSKGLFLSGISAGLDIGFSVLLMTVAVTAFTNIFSEPIVRVIVANMYPIGFIFVILGRSELFTEHTTLATLPVLQKLASLRKLLRLWIIVYVSNIVGGIVFALILSYLVGALHFLQPWAIQKVSHELLQYNWITSFIGAMLAGWMMGLLAWLVAASRETISQIFVIWLVTAAIGFIGLPHCIVGNIEVLAAVFSGEASMMQYLGFIVPVTIGNAIGGVLFVGVLKFSHTTFSGDEKTIDLEAVQKQNTKSS